MTPEKFNEWLQKERENADVTGHWDDVIIDVEDTEIHILESENQCLQLRVGPVFTSKEEGGSVHPGLWIGYQEKYMNSPRHGDMLLSKKVWDALKEEIDRRFAEFDIKDYYIRD